MSHELDMSNDRVNFAFTGSRKAIWHGLGQELTPGSSLDEWEKEAGMNWSVEKGDLYNVQTNSLEESAFSLYRSDTMKHLSIVSKKFHVVQPKDVLGFFKDLVEGHGMTLSTAGCLKGGIMFWALADTGNYGEVVKGDPIKGNLMLVTSVDGKMSTVAKFVSTRVVCNNTMQVALSEKAKSVVRQTHRSIWDERKAKIELRLPLSTMNDTWSVFMSNLKRLSEREMKDSEVKAFFEKTFFDPKKEEQTNGTIKKIDVLMNLYDSGEGSNFSRGTAYGALNAITDYYSHGNGSRTKDSAFSKAYIDTDTNQVRVNAMMDLLSMT